MLAGSVTDSESRLEGLLDKVAELQAAGNLKAQQDVRAPAGDAPASAVAYLLAAPHFRPEHRQRIYNDLIKNRELILRLRDPRLIDLIHWSEHVERLFVSQRGGALSFFHYHRALQATCRRCDFDITPAMGDLEALGRDWGSRNYEATLRMLAPVRSEVEQHDDEHQAAL
jgi:hypothetical protein